ncbi:MAG: transposase, partial [Candidatus Competibacter sp.]
PRMSSWTNEDPAGRRRDCVGGRFRGAARGALAKPPGAARPAAVRTLVAPSVRASFFEICYNFHVVSSISYKLRFYPNAAQRQQLAVDFGVARWAWNTALDARSFCYRALGRSVSGADCSRAITELKADPAYAWLKDANSTAITQALRDQDRAFANFYAKRAGFPKFKSKRGPQSARYQLDQRNIHRTFDAATETLVLPKLGKLKLRWSQPITGIPKMATVSHDAVGDYYVSISCEIEINELPPTNKAVGIDLGIKDVIVTSDGAKSGNPKFIEKYKRQLKRAQQVLSRRVKWSGRWHRARVRVAKIQRKTARCRADFLHKLTTGLVRAYGFIATEDLNLSGMLKNQKLAKAVADISGHELMRQLAYKAQWYGREVVKIGRFERSTGVCPDCGLIAPKLALSVRRWQCECGAAHDRDIAAAQTILNIAAGRAVTARGEIGRCQAA